MAYRFVPFPVTLNDVECYSPVARFFKCNSNNICATFRTVSTNTSRRAVPQRQPSFLFCRLSRFRRSALRVIASVNNNVDHLSISQLQYYGNERSLPAPHNIAFCCWIVPPCNSLYDSARNQSKLKKMDTKLLLSAAWKFHCRRCRCEYASGLYFQAASHASHRCGILLHMSHVPWSVFVYLSAGHTGLPCENGYTRSRCGLMSDSRGYKEPLLDGVHIQA